MVGVVLLMCLSLEIYQPILVIDFCCVGIIVGSVYKHIDWGIKELMVASV